MAISQAKEPCYYRAYRHDNTLGFNMSYIRYKKVGEKTYCYEVEAYWDAQKQYSRQKTKYLGVLGKDKKIEKRKSKVVEKVVLDFGDSYFLSEFIKSTNIYGLLEELKHKELMPLLIYRLCNQSAMRNCSLWSEGNYIKYLFPDSNLSSQNISMVLKDLGKDKLQADFFREYLKLFKDSEGIIIDATSLPNQISSSFSHWGRNGNSIDMQFRFLCVLDQKNKVPLYYRFLPGNIVDVNTLHKTIKELELLGLKKSFVLIDAGYFSEENIRELYKLKINFISRLPAGRTVHKELLASHTKDLESSFNAVKFHDRGFFVKKTSLNLFDNKCFAYLVLDPARKGKEVSELLSSDYTTEQLAISLQQCGIMILISSIDFEPLAAVSAYYSRQSVEQVFGFFKDDLDSLPIRCHNDDTIKGYLFLQFLTLIVFTQLRTKLPNKFSVEQALLILRTLKAKLFDSHVVISEKTKNVRLIYDSLHILVPNFLRI